MEKPINVFLSLFFKMHIAYALVRIYLYMYDMNAAEESAAFFTVVICGV